MLTAEQAMHLGRLANYAIYAEANYVEERTPESSREAYEAWDEFSAALLALVEKEN